MDLLCHLLHWNHSKFQLFLYGYEHGFDEKGGISCYVGKKGQKGMDTWQEEESHFWKFMIYLKSIPDEEGGSRCVACLKKSKIMQDSCEVLSFLTLALAYVLLTCNVVNLSDMQNSYISYTFDIPHLTPDIWMVLLFLQYMPQCQHATSKSHLHFCFS